MKYFFTLLIGVLPLAFNSCTQTDPNKEIDEGIVEENTYTSQELGWTINIPDKWEVVSRDELQEKMSMGEEAIEETYEEDIDASTVKNLISFKKDQFNIFTSTSQPFDEEYPNQWNEVNTEIRGMLYHTYVSKGIKVDSSSSETVIDGQKFYVSSFALYSPKGELILNQDMYSCLRNDIDFAATLNYNNPVDKEIMEKALKGSKFQ